MARWRRRSGWRDLPSMNGTLDRQWPSVTPAPLTGAVVEIVDRHSSGSTLVADSVTINGVDAGLVESVQVDTDAHEVVRVTVVLLPSRVVIQQVEGGE